MAAIAIDVYLLPYPVLRLTLPEYGQFHPPTQLHKKTQNSASTDSRKNNYSTASAATDRTKHHNTNTQYKHERNNEYTADK